MKIKITIKIKFMRLIINGIIAVLKAVLPKIISDAAAWLTNKVNNIKNK